MARSLAVVVLAAGAGTRMKSELPKVLHKLAGWTMLKHVLTNVSSLNPSRIVGVVGPGQRSVVEAFRPYETVVQTRPLGTGHAVRAALPALKGHRGPVLIVYGDSPLVLPRTMARLVAKCSRTRTEVGVLGFRAADPAPYGRLIVENSELLAIVESKEANVQQRRIDFCNSGVMCIDGASIAGLLSAITNDNAKSEFYLTDVVEIARATNRQAIAVEGKESEFQGINSRMELAMAERTLQSRLRAAALETGVSMLDPQTVWLSADTKFGRDVTLGPNVCFHPGVTVGANVEIRGFCDIAGARIGSGAIVGPFARIRPGSLVGKDVHIGNFVELKATTMQRGSKANHLAYIGDADIGARSNIGAGTIAVNYDGYGKHRTVIGDDSFVGSNSSLVAPVRIGRGANVAAGSVITADVPAGALAFGRARQITKKGRATTLRSNLKMRAAARKRGEKS